MNKKYIILIVLSSIFIIIGISIFIFTQKMSVKYILNISKYRIPSDFIKEDKYIKISDDDVSVLHYYNSGVDSSRYFLLIHGLTSLANKHPRIDHMAKSICDATGINVLVPQVWGGKYGKKKLNYSIEHIYNVYMALNEKYPGKYYGFGSCIGGNAFLKSLQKVPKNLYPKKILLYGAYFSGKDVERFYNDQKNVDFLVRLAFALNSDKFKEEDKDLILEAIESVEPGRTDEQVVKKILGDKLFHTIAVVNMKDPLFGLLGLDEIFKDKLEFPDCKFYLIHSSRDFIVPYFEGEKMYNFFKQHGVEALFHGTELIDHTSDNVSTKGLISELNYLIDLFDDLFMEEH